MRHATYGVGVATSSNEDRTTIDFYEHGRKTFVTSLLQAEPLAEAPPRPSKRRKLVESAAATEKSGGTK